MALARCAGVTLAASPSSFLPLREIALVALGALALYAFLAIASYSPNDPALTFADPNATVSNWVGKSGAWVADIALLVFGWAAYLVPLALALAALRTRLRTPPWSWPLVGARAFGWMGIAIAACVLADMHVAKGPHLMLPANAGPGGALGASLVAFSLPALHWPGLTLIAMAVLLVSAPGALGWSWLAMCEAVGKGLHRGTAWVAQGVLAARPTPKPARVATAAAPPPTSVEIAPAPRLDPAPTAPKAQAKAPPKAKKAIEPTVSKPPKRRAATPPAPADAVGELPDLELLEPGLEIARGGFSDESLEDMAQALRERLADFGVSAQVTSVVPGPVVTRFEVQPAPGVKVSRINNLAKDLARELAVVSVRIVDIIPGKSVVGIEIPNERRAMVRLREILDSRAFRESTSPLTMALGKDIAGEPVLADIARMPHLLIAGTTGSGKSVGVNAMLISMLYKASPDELRLILVDPKMLELAVYADIPHLLTPVVTDMKDAAAALNWCVGEMERRYRLMAALGVRNLEGYNRSVDEAKADGEPILDPLWPTDGDGEAPALERLPLILVVIDEFADLMMVVGKKVDQLIARIAQKARAAGIHLVLATQRPSVDVITGLIKSNIPTRISFQVSSALNSRVVLDQGGAEQLLGHGDMLYLPPGTSVPTRVHGAFVDEREVHGVVADWRRRAEPDYIDGLLAAGTSSDVPGTLDLSDGDDAEQSDPLYDDAVEFVLDSGRASISAVQRKLRIGYQRAARMVEAMEAAGVVSAMDTSGNREVLVPRRG